MPLELPTGQISKNTLASCTRAISQIRKKISFIYNYSSELEKSSWFFHAMHNRLIHCGEVQNIHKGFVHIAILSSCFTFVRYDRQTMLLSVNKYKKSLADVYFW